MQKSHINFAKKSALLMAACLGLALAGCQSVRDKISPSNLFHRGEKDKVKEDASRIAVLASTDVLAVDPNLAAIDVVIPNAVQFNSWANAGGNLANAPQNIAGDGSLSVLWHRNAGSGASKKTALTASPLIVDGKIYTFDSHLNVHAISQSDGRKIWTRSIAKANRSRGTKRVDNNIIGGGIAYENGKIFATTGNGEVIALDAQNGAVLWTNESTSPIHAAPIANNGRVYVVSTANEYFAIDAQTGETLWTQSAMPESTRVLSSASPAIVGDTLVMPFASGELIASLTANGRKLWTDNLSRVNSGTSLSAINDIAGHPVISGGSVYAASQSGVVVAVDLRSGVRIWQQSIGSIQSPWVAGNSVYVISTDAQLVCINSETGTVKWTKQLASFKNERKHKGRITWAGPIMVGSRLVLGSSTGTILEIDPRNGEIVNTIRGRGEYYISPIAVDGIVYFYSNNGDLLALK